MKNKLYIGIISVSILMQKVFVSWRGNSLEHQGNFLLSGVPYCDNLVNHNLYLILWLFPIAVILFLFNGEAKQLYHGYGILKIIRGESKYKVILKKEASICIHSFCILFLYSLIMQESAKFSRAFMKSFLMLYLTFITVLLFQFLLEHFFVDNIIVFCGILVWFSSSIMLSNIFRTNDNFEVWQYAIIPNFAFVQRNGLCQIQSTPNVCLELSVLSIIFILVVICSIAVGNKKDLI